MELGNIFGHHFALHYKGCIDFVTENSFSWMTSKFSIVTTLFIFLKICSNSDINSI